MSLHNNICIIYISEEETDFFSTHTGGFYHIANASEPGAITSLGYPFSYQSSIMYIWKITSANRLKVRITFVDISLHELMVRIILPPSREKWHSDITHSVMWRTPIRNKKVYTTRNILTVIDVTSVKKCRPWSDAAS